MRHVMVWAMLALAGCAAGDQACKLSYATEVPLRVTDSGAMVATMRFDEGQADLLVDTGSFATVLTAAAAKRLDESSRALFGARVNGIGGSRSVHLAQPHELQLGRLTGRSFFVPTVDFTMPADGLLGMDILGAYDVDFDTLNARMILLKAPRVCAHPTTMLAGTLGIVPFEHREQSYRPIVEVMYHDQPLHAIFDTGAARTAVYRDAAERIGLAPAVPGEPVSISRGIGPDPVKTVKRMLDEVRFGDITVSRLPVGVLDQHSEQKSDMLLGRDFIRRVHVWLSNSSKTLIIQTPPQPTDFKAPAPAEAKS